MSYPDPAYKTLPGGGLMKKVTAGAPVEYDTLKELAEGKQDKNKAYAPLEFSGLGKKTLEKNIVDVSGTDKNVLTQAMMQDANTIYVIQYDYDLNGQSITVPSGCVLQFDGGSLSNGTLVGSNTAISADIVKIFSTNVTLSGTWDVNEVYAEWFGATGDGVIDDTSAIQKAIDFASAAGIHNTRLLSKTYKITEPLTLNSRARLYCERYASRADNSPYCKVLYSGDSSALILNDSSSIVRDISIQNIGFFTTNNNASCIRFGSSDFVHKTFLSVTISSCYINGFRHGIYVSLAAKGGFASNRFVNCDFRSNVFGIYITAEDSTAWMTTNQINKCGISNNQLWAIYLSGIDSAGNRIVLSTLEGNGTGYAYDDYVEYGSGAVHGGGFEITGCYIEGNIPKRAVGDYGTDVEEIINDYVVPINRNENAKCACFVGNQLNVHDNYINKQHIIISCTAAEIHIESRNNNILAGSEVAGFIYVEATNYGQFKYSSIVVHEFNRNLSYTRVFDRFIFDNTKASYLVRDVFDVRTNFSQEQNISSNDVYETIYIGSDVSRSGYGCVVSCANSTITSIVSYADDWVNSRRPCTLSVIQDTNIGYGKSKAVLNKKIIIDGNNHHIAGYSGSVGFSITGCEVIIQNCNFDSCSRLLTVNNNNKITLINCVFDACSTSLITLVNLSKGNKISIINCTFLDTNAASFRLISAPGYRDYEIYELGNTYATSNSVIGLPKKTGTFSAKPATSYPVGNVYYVEDRNIPIYWNGTGWYNSDGSGANAKKSGTTASRPASADIYVGFQYWDTDLGKMIAWNGTAWVNLDGTALS